jgi:probable addiction module antidote protein
MMAKAPLFDAAEYLDGPGMIAEYLNEALETGDDEIVARALGAVARAQGMSAVAHSAGVSRPSLYRSLNIGGKPELSTVMKVLNAFGVRLVAKSAARRVTRKGHIASQRARQHSRRASEHA